MRKNGPNVQICETVTGMDLLVSKVGERDGGIVREEHFEVLEEKMRWLVNDNFNRISFTGIWTCADLVLSLMQVGVLASSVYQC